MIFSAVFAIIYCITTTRNICNLLYTVSLKIFEFWVLRFKRLCQLHVQLILSPNSFQRMAETDEQIHSWTACEGAQNKYVRLKELLGLKGHLQDELLRIEAMLAEDDPELKVRARRILLLISFYVWHIHQNEPLRCSDHDVVLHLSTTNWFRYILLNVIRISHRGRKKNDTYLTDCTLFNSLNYLGGRSGIPFLILWLLHLTNLLVFISCLAIWTVSISASDYTSVSQICSRGDRSCPRSFVFSRHTCIRSFHT